MSRLCFVLWFCGGRRKGQDGIKWWVVQEEIGYQEGLGDKKRGDNTK